MKGTDCTAEQLQQASLFLAARGWPKVVPATMPRREDIVRLIAWYGAMRYVAGRDGTGGSLEQPGELIATSKAADREESA